MAPSCHLEVVTLGLMKRPTSSALLQLLCKSVFLVRLFLCSPHLYLSHSLEITL